MVFSHRRCVSLCSVLVLFKMSQDCVRRDVQPPIHLFQVEWCVLNTIQELGKMMTITLLKINTNLKNWMHPSLLVPCIS